MHFFQGGPMKYGVSVSRENRPPINRFEVTKACILEYIRVSLFARYSD